MSADEKAGRQPIGIPVLRAVPMPRDTNPMGDVFGGWIVSQMDIAGGLMASEVAQGRTVPLTMDKIIFERPVRVGRAIAVWGQLLHVDHSSLDVTLEVWAKQVIVAHEAERHPVTESVFRYITIDDLGTPRRVPDNPQYFSRDAPESQE
jgi:acyl-CoA thioesterase YciA